MTRGNIRILTIQLDKNLSFQVINKTWDQSLGVNFVSLANRYEIRNRTWFGKLFRRINVKSGSASVHSDVDSIKTILTESIEAYLTIWGLDSIENVQAN